ncbi:unnamed protein product [Arctogadus glacialis]
MYSACPTCEVNANPPINPASVCEKLSVPLNDDEANCLHHGAPACWSHTKLHSTDSWRAVGSPALSPFLLPSRPCYLTLWLTPPHEAFLRWLLIDASYRPIIRFPSPNHVGDG